MITPGMCPPCVAGSTCKDVNPPPPQKNNNFWGHLVPLFSSKLVFIYIYKIYLTVILKLPKASRILAQYFPFSLPTNATEVSLELRRTIHPVRPFVKQWSIRPWPNVGGGLGVYAGCSSGTTPQGVPPGVSIRYSGAFTSVELVSSPVFVR